MEKKTAIIIGIYTKGSGHSLTVGEREAIKDAGVDIPQLIVEDWWESPSPAHFALDMNVVVVVTTALGAGVLGGALAEAGKDAYSATKRAIARLVHFKVKEQYRTNVVVTYTMRIDDFPIAINLPLFRSVEAVEISVNEIEDRLSSQIEAAVHAWPEIEQEVRAIWVASHEDPSRRYPASQVTFLGGKPIVEPGLSIPGWMPLLNAPLIFQRDDQIGYGRLDQGGRWRRDPDDP